MLEHSFILLRGVGEKREEALWERFPGGLPQFVDTPPGSSGLQPPKLERRLRQQAAEILAQLANGRVVDSARELQRVHRWRLLPALLEHAVYVDIEATGVDFDQDQITVVGVYGPNGFRSYVRGIDLDQCAEPLSAAPLLVTFNGHRFDLPFLERRVPGFARQGLHFDLRPVLLRTKLEGGLKKMERALGVTRPPDVVESDGLQAQRLWARWEHDGDRDALMLLLRYNWADTVNMALMAVHAHNRMLARLPAELAARFPRLPLPTLPQPPSATDLETMLGLGACTA